MSEMIERIALAARALDDTIWVGDNQMLYFRRVAVAAIEAMREPTEVMIAILLRNMSENEHNPNVSFDAAFLWQSLIDEALK